MAPYVKCQDAEATENHMTDQMSELMLVRQLRISLDQAARQRDRIRHVVNRLVEYEQRRVLPAESTNEAGALYVCCAALRKSL